MKKLITTITILLVVLNVNALGIKKAKDGESADSKFFFGTTGGFKNHYGFLGIIGSVNVIDAKTYVGAGAGLSLYNLRLGVDIQRFSKENRSGFCIGLSVGHGIASSTVDVENNAGNIIGKIEQTPVPSATLILGNHWKINEKFRFYIQTGYTQGFGNCLTATKTNVITEDDQLNFDATVLASKLANPFGLMTGLGFTYGF